MFVLPPLIAGAVTAMLIAAMLRLGARLPLDYPNARSLHVAPVPRTGGVALMAGLAAGCALAVATASAEAPLQVLLPAFGLALPSFVDDWRGLAMYWRLLFHAAAAGVFVMLALPTEPVWLQATLVVATVWMTNLYNFMDGADGLAGGMAVFGFGSLAWAGLVAGDAALSMVCACVATAALAFLAFNFNPAKIFMGDAGSIPLGFLAAALGISGWSRGNWGLWFPLIVFSPFIVDATLTLLRRLLRGERIWQAHREHYYQQLVQLGWGHRRTALAEYGLMLVCASAALLALHAGSAGRAVLFAGIPALYAALAMLVARRWRAHHEASRK